MVIQVNIVKYNGSLKKLILINFCPFLVLLLLIFRMLTHLQNSLKNVTTFINNVIIDIRV